MCLLSFIGSGAIGLFRQPGEAGPKDPSAEVFLAFGRVFAGVLRDGAPVQVHIELCLLFEQTATLCILPTYSRFQHQRSSIR